MADSKTYALLAEFDTPAAIMEAAAEVRDAGFKNWDVHTPFPVHGMDEAMGLENSKVGWYTFCGGSIGFFGGMLMIWFMNSYDYGITVGGKPLFSPMFAFPVSYEMTILFSAFGSIIGMLLLNRLPRLHHPLLKNPRFRAVTHDKFFIVIETSDAKYSDKDTRKLLEGLGSSHVEPIEE